MFRSKSLEAENSSLDDSSIGKFFATDIFSLGRKILRRIVLRRKVLHSDDSSPESFRYFFVRAGNSSSDNSLPGRIYARKIICRIISQKKKTTWRRNILRPGYSSGLFFAEKFFAEEFFAEVIFGRAKDFPLGVFFAELFFAGVLEELYGEELFYAMFLSVEFSGTGFQEKLH
jgi:hypothetical protein